MSGHSSESFKSTGCALLRWGFSSRVRKSKIYHGRGNDSLYRSSAISTVRGGIGELEFFMFMSGFVGFIRLEQGRLDMRVVLFVIGLRECEFAVSSYSSHPREMP